MYALCAVRPCGKVKERFFQAVYKISDQLLFLNEDRTRRSFDPEEIAFFAANISRSANLLNSVRDMDAFLTSLEDRIAVPKLKKKKKKKRVCICYSSEYRKCSHGSQGPPGPVGKPGLDGELGVNGLPGEPGKDARAYVLPEECYQCLSPGGLPGPPGHHGILIYIIEPSENGYFAGVAGIRGKPGKPGCGGAHGIKGASGRRGFLGLSGDRGDDGEPGDAGQLGPTGSVGDPGLPGNNGLDGIICPCPSRSLPAIGSRWNRLKAVFQRGKS
ncbi:Collagen domain containing protein [Trichuris trichiura]|uniref:Collagen domain containing protein n=1 Tax=Trichuris trichiura TaxID=36087 RepID=A0A077ZFM5_TRITR|nr:Collagen domain containing protein [Trichuris trichiura]